MMKQWLTPLVLMIPSLLLLACSSTPQRTVQHQYVTNTTPEANVPVEPVIYPEIFQPVVLDYTPVDLTTTASISLDDETYVDDYAYEDSYSSEWWQYYQGDGYHLPDQYDVDLPNRVTYYSYYVPYWAPYQYYTVGQYFPHSNMAIAVSVSSLGYPGYSPYHYSAYYDDYYNPFWDDQWASYRYSHRYRAGGFAYLQPFHYWYSPYYYHRHYWGYWGHYAWGAPHYWHYYHHPIYVIKPPQTSPRRQPRVEQPQREPTVVLPAIESAPRDPEDSPSKPERNPDLWSRPRIPRSGLSNSPSQNVLYRFPNENEPGSDRSTQSSRPQTLSPLRQSYNSDSTIYPLEPRRSYPSTQNRLDIRESITTSPNRTWQSSPTRSSSPSYTAPRYEAPRYESPRYEAPSYSAPSSGSSSEPERRFPTTSPTRSR